MCTKTLEFLGEFLQKNRKILRDLNNLKLTMPSSKLSQNVEKIKKKFDFLHKNWQSLVLRLDDEVKGNIERNKEISRNMRKSFSFRGKIEKYKTRIRSQEMYVEGRERCAGKSLNRVRKWWRKSLDNMESSLEYQNSVIERVSQDDCKRFERMKDDWDQSGSCECGFSCVCESEIKADSGFNPFLNSPDDIESFRFTKSKDKILKKKKNLLKSRSEEERDTLPDSVSINEVKQALFVLKKANLLDDKGNSALLRIAEIMKKPENTSNFELVLQLIEIENQKNSKSIYKSSKVRCDKPLFKRKDLFDTSLENSITEGLLSSSHEILDSKVLGNIELKDVNLEDLLQVDSVLEGFGLKSVSASFMNKLNGNNGGLEGEGLAVMSP